jgi:hypothetical protein
VFKHPFGAIGGECFRPPLSSFKCLSESLRQPHNSSHGIRLRHVPATLCGAVNAACGGRAVGSEPGADEGVGKTGAFLAVDSGMRSCLQIIRTDFKKVFSPKFSRSFWRSNFPSPMICAWEQSAVQFQTLAMKL